MRISTQAGAALLVFAVSLADAQPTDDAQKPRHKAPRPPTALQHRFEPWLGDFDGMLERRLVRVLVPYSRTLYFNDKGAQRGLTAAAVRDLERFLADKFKLRGRPITVIAMPTTREKLLAGLVEGRGDIAAGNITITAARDRLVDFSDPFAEGVAEIVVTGPASPRLSTLEDLAGREVHVRRSSSYYESLRALDLRFRAEGRRPMRLTLVPDALEDEDLMDMLGAGLLKLIIVDSWKADIWAGMVRTIKPRGDLELGGESSIGWAFRSDSPKLAAVVNEYLHTYAASRAVRDEQFPQYVKELRNVTASTDWVRFEKTIALFRKYGRIYRFDYLMLAAQAYQESRLDPDARSKSGAIGLMQLLPSTAQGIAVHTGGSRFRVSDLDDPEINVRYGAWYLHHLLQKYGDERLALAAYNAGQQNVDTWRAEGKGVQFPETRAYVDEVERLKDIYRRTYPRELGLSG